MKKLFSLFIVALMSLMLVSPLVSSFFPVTHRYQQVELLNTYEGDSQFYEACLRNSDSCYVGNVLSDFSIAWYFLNGGENYIVSHSPSFGRALFRNAVGDVEVICAVGASLHFSQDYQSHNFMVPDSIRRTGLPNSILHVFAEQHGDTIISERYPYIVNDIVLLQEESWEKCIPLFRRTLAGYSEYQDEIESGKLDDVIYTFIDNVQDSITAGNTGYDVSFKNKVSIFGRLSFVPISFLITYISITFLFLTLTILILFRRKKGILKYLSIILLG